MITETTPNLKQQVSRERAWRLGEAGNALGIQVHVIADEGQKVQVSHNQDFTVMPNHVGIDLRGGAQPLDTQIINELRNNADRAQHAE